MENPDVKILSVTKNSGFIRTEFDYSGERFTNLQEDPKSNYLPVVPIINLGERLDPSKNPEMYALLP
jgi:hypothetical protein